MKARVHTLYTQWGKVINKINSSFIHHSTPQVSAITRVHKLFICECFLRGFALSHSSAVSCVFLLCTSSLSALPLFWNEAYSFMCFCVHAHVGMEAALDHNVGWSPECIISLYGPWWAALPVNRAILKAVFSNYVCLLSGSTLEQWSQMVNGKKSTSHNTHPILTKILVCFLFFFSSCKHTHTHFLLLLAAGSSYWAESALCTIFGSSHTVLM